MRRYKYFISACVFLFLVIFIDPSSLCSQEKFREVPPYPEPLAQLRLPDIESAILSNGLTLSVISKSNLPIISMQLIIFTGESSSPEELPGTATCTARMLVRGAGNLSSSEIEETIEYIGGNFSSSLCPDYSAFNFTFLEEYLDEALKLLRDMILSPTFDRHEIENIKRSMFYDLLMKNEDPEFIAKRQLFRILFRNHPYKKMAYNEDVIKKITQRDIHDFFNNYYRPNNALFILTGDLNISTASRKISHYFNTWKNTDLPQPLLSSPEPFTHKKICLVHIPEAKDTTIYMGNVIMPANSDDFFPFAVLNQVLGGTPNSRLFMNLRESKGYAYFAFSQLEFFKSCGVFLIREKVRPEVTYASIKETLKEIEQVTKEKTPSFEIEQAKSYLIGNFPLQIENFNELFLKISEIRAFNLGEKHWSKYYENIMLVNPEKVFEVAKKHLLLSPVVVIVGNKNALVDQIRKFDNVEVYSSNGMLLYSLKNEGENSLN